MCAAGLLSASVGASLVMCLLSGVAGCVVQAAGAETGRTVGPERPNNLFILVDDQGYYDLGCCGATEVKTPRIDASARAGIRFTDY